LDLNTEPAENLATEGAGEATERQQKSKGVSDEQTRREEEAKEQIFQKWKEEILSEHLVFIKGVELVYFEFREILVELALRLKDYVEGAQPGKLKSLVKKFLEELFLKRLLPYIKFISTKSEKMGVTGMSEVSSTVRTWPESEKDKVIKVAMEKKRLEDMELAKIKA